MKRSNLSESTDTKKLYFENPEKMLSELYLSLFGSYEQRWGMTETPSPHGDMFDGMSTVMNRSKGQTRLLYELCDKSFHKWLKLEKHLYENFVFFCPGDKETVDVLLNTK